MDRLSGEDIEKGRSELADLERRFLERVAMTNRCKTNGEESKGDDGNLDRARPTHVPVVTQPWMMPPTSITPPPATGVPMRVIGGPGANTSANTTNSGASGGGAGVQAPPRGAASAEAGAGAGVGVGGGGSMLRVSVIGAPAGSFTPLSSLPFSFLSPPRPPHPQHPHPSQAQNTTTAAPPPSPPPTPQLPPPSSLPSTKPPLTPPGGAGAGGNGQVGVDSNTQGTGVDTAKPSEAHEQASIVGVKNKNTVLGGGAGTGAGAGARAGAGAGTGAGAGGEGGAGAGVRAGARAGAGAGAVAEGGEGGRFMPRTTSLEALSLLDLPHLSTMENMESLVSLGLSAGTFGSSQGSAT
ncbi:unnamed protein product, partial [Discosporangium mesarthrocarpum]